MDDMDVSAMLRTALLGTVHTFEHFTRGHGLMFFVNIFDYRGHTASLSPTAVAFHFMYLLLLRYPSGVMVLGGRVAKDYVVLTIHDNTPALIELRNYCLLKVLLRLQSTMNLTNLCRTHVFLSRRPQRMSLGVHIPRVELE